MFQKIIWATDGSEAADAALPQLREIAGSNGTQIVVLHCEETFVGPVAYGLDVSAGEDEIKAKINKQAKDLQSEGLDVTTEFVSGRSGIAAHAIADAAKSDGADLILVGTRGHTALGGLLVGSVTQRLLQVAPCPVMAVPVH
jgi:nucleotide-binding universal stress UspA family protein